MKRRERRTCILHGMSRSKIYHRWWSMIQRCEDPKMPCYKNYGGRGIRVCKSWREDFTNFYADMGEPPTPKHQLDRIDNSKGYSPENCRWVTLEEQQSNTRNNTFYTYKNERLTAAQWARKVGISKELLHYRISAGWTLERALTTKPRVVA